MKLAYACLTAAAVTGAAGAQEIVLYQNENFDGPRYSASGAVPDLAPTGFNDRASSVTIRGSSFQLCADSYYRGQCITLGPGDYPSLGRMGLGNAISSMRDVGWHGGGSGGGGGGPGAGAIVFYESPGQTGRSYALSGALPNFSGTGFNDRASSAVINSGTWQICSDADYQGSCEIFNPGSHGNLGSVTGRVSSARPYPSGGGGGNWGGGGGGNWGGGQQTRVVLYEGANFQGRAYTVDSDVLPNLDGTGFNDRASSIRVERGYWMFCTDANFLGDCRTFGPGDYPTLSWFSNRISSGRRISNDYPYNAAPQWRN
ncbi:MAG: beta/gamma crystallin family protein [Burkholderiales bacterium]|nr:beta/gamma crystallin family protein [Burkholderiales bacterium]